MLLSALQTSLLQSVSSRQCFFWSLFLLTVFFPRLSRPQTPSQFSPTQQEVFMQLGEGGGWDAAAAALVRGHDSRRRPCYRAELCGLSIFQPQTALWLQLHTFPGDPLIRSSAPFVSEPLSVFTALYLADLRQRHLI